MKKLPVRSAIAISVAGIMTIALAQPASAEAPSTPYVEAGIVSEQIYGQDKAQLMSFDEEVSDSAEDIEAAIIATGAIDEGPRVVPAQNSAGKISVPDQELVLPSEGDASLVHEGLGLAISLPPESSSGDARLSETGVLVYEAEPGQSASAVAVTAEGTSLITTIPDSSVSHEYTYGVNGGVPELTSEGGVRVYQDVLLADEEGNLSTSREISVAFSPPWAIDAGGNRVPTHYEIRGAAIVQIVDFTEENQFPVTADPHGIWGWTLCVAAVASFVLGFAVGGVKLVKILSSAAKIKSAVARALKTWQAFKITKGMSASKIRQIKAQRNKALRKSLGVAVAAVLGTDVIIEKCA